MKLLVLLIGICISLNTFANSYWTKEHNSSKQINSNPTYLLDIDAFNIALSSLKSGTSVEVSLPRQNGDIEQFTVSQTQVLATDLALKYPNIKTFKIQHVSDKSILGRMELIDDQLTAMIKTSNNQELISSNKSSYKFQSYSVRNKGRNFSSGSFSCGTKMSNNSNQLSMKFPTTSQYRTSPNTLKKLRVAIATTVEYSAEFCGTTSTVLAEIAIALNRINEVYESELAVTLELVSGNEAIIFLDTDTFDNDNANQMIDENQLVIDNAIGNSNYDLGHVFSTGGGGLASLGSVCSSSIKANGVTGRHSPIDDPFWIDYVAHEIGHQLGAEHTYNGTSSSCSGNRVASSAFEPGSGSTIMAYAGICGAENLQSNSDASFHFNSIAQIDAELTSKNSCGTNVSYSSVHDGQSNLNSPIVNAGNDYDIPINTPFMLTASATDADGDDVYYQWDGADKGGATNSATFGTDTGGVLFRSNLPQTHPERYFPSLKDLLNGDDHKGEALPTTTRSISFKLKATDNKGGHDSDDVTLNSDSSIGPFLVTSQSTPETYTASQSVNVTWDVSNTTSAPVSCATVDIQLLTINNDNSSFCKTDYWPNESNDGSALVTLPDINSSKSRFLIKCSDNVFFAINDNDFTISGGATNVSNNCLNTGGEGALADTSYTSMASTCVPGTNFGQGGEESSGGGGSWSLWFLYYFFGLLGTRRYFKNF